MFGDLERVFTATESELRQVDGIGPILARRIADGCRNAKVLEQELTLAQQAGVRIVTLEEPDYPKALREIHDPPLALYIRGSLPREEVAVAVVGSRHASLYGLQTAERLAYELALRGVTVVSGLARGIDGEAHRGALKAGGRTLAVLGNGLAHIYPTEHEELATQIAERGALISEYPMTMPPLGQNFPRRNRLISGLSLGVVIVEAAQRSGALITANCALEQGREVFAVPGPITTTTSQGTHQLLKEGARLVTSVEDIIEELRLTPQVVTSTVSDVAGQAALQLPEREARVLAWVRGTEPRVIDTIAAESVMGASEVSSALLQLELRRLVEQRPGKQFIRRSI